MAEFTPGEQKTAKIPMTNPTGKAFDYSAQLYMGMELAIMSEIPFHLEAGESKDISMLVTMPMDAGVYPVNIGAFSNGQFIEPVYHAEDITIVEVSPWPGWSAWVHGILIGGYPGLNISFTRSEPFWQVTGVIGENNYYSLPIIEPNVYKIYLDSSYIGSATLHAGENELNFTTAGVRECPYCGRYIPLEADYCPYCGRYF